MLIEFISEKNNTYEFSIQSDDYFDTVFIYAPNYDTALSRAKNYSKHLEPGVKRMNNNLLWKELCNNRVYTKDDDIIIDELFQIMKARINKDNHIVIIIFTPLNYANTDGFTSHHSNMGKYFYNNKKKGEIIRFMLDEEKSIDIDEKHDRLRKAIFSKR